MRLNIYQRAHHIYPRFYDRDVNCSKTVNLVYICIFNFNIVVFAIVLFLNHDSFN